MGTAAAAAAMDILTPPPSPPPTPPPSPPRAREPFIPEPRAAYVRRLDGVNENLEAMIESARRRRGSPAGPTGGGVDPAAWAAREAAERRAQRAEAQATDAVRALREAEARECAAQTAKDGRAAQQVDEMWAEAAKEAARDAVEEMRAEIAEAKRKMAMAITEEASDVRQARASADAELAQAAADAAGATRQEEVEAATRQVEQAREAEEAAMLQAESHRAARETAEHDAEVASARAAASEREAVEYQGRYAKLAISARQAERVSGEQLAAVEAVREVATTEAEDARGQLGQAEASKSALELEMRAALEQLQAKNSSKANADASFYAEQVVRAEKRAAQTDARLRQLLAETADAGAAHAVAAREAQELQEGIEDRLREAIDRQRKVEEQLQKAEARAQRAERQAREAARTALAAASAARSLALSETRSQSPSPVRSMRSSSSRSSLAGSASELRSPDLGIPARYAEPEPRKRAPAPARTQSDVGVQGRLTVEAEKVKRSAVARDEQSTEQTYYCERRCGFSGNFEAVAQHEEDCMASVGGTGVGAVETERWRAAAEAETRARLEMEVAAAREAESARVVAILESAASTRLVAEAQRRERAESKANAESARVAAERQVAAANREHIFHCEKQCGFSGDFDTVARHEAQCTAGQSAAVSVERLGGALDQDSCSDQVAARGGAGADEARQRFVAAESKLHDVLTNFVDMIVLQLQWKVQTSTVGKQRRPRRLVRHRPFSCIAFHIRCLPWKAMSTSATSQSLSKSSSSQISLPDIDGMFGQIGPVVDTSFELITVLETAGESQLASH